MGKGSLRATLSTEATSETTPIRAARQIRAGRLLSLVLVSVGVVAVGASSFAESWLRAEWFWAEPDREAARERRDHFDKLYAALIVENSRRARAGRPKLAEEPEALRLARERLDVALRPMLTAQQRPRQIATALRIGGAALCLAGVACGLASRHRAPSASDDAAAQ